MLHISFAEKIVINKDIVQLAEKIEDYIIDPEDMEETKNEH